MPPPRKTIAVVDDEVALRNALERLVRAAGYRCESFASAEEFLAVAAGLGAACLLADIHLGWHDGPGTRAASDGDRPQTAGADHVGIRRPAGRRAGAGDRRGIPAQARSSARVVRRASSTPLALRSPRAIGDVSRQPWSNPFRGGMGPWADPAARVPAPRSQNMPASAATVEPSSTPSRTWPLHLIRRETPACPGTGSW